METHQEEYYTGLGMAQNCLGNVISAFWIENSAQGAWVVEVGRAVKSAIISLPVLTHVWC
jgi:hypothetical protein